MIISIKPSPVKNKRFRATILKHEGKEMKIDFGYPSGSTYIDGNRTNDERYAYLARHLGNKREKYLIENNILSPALLSAKILWGSSKSLQKNVDELNKLL